MSSPRVLLFESVPWQQAVSNNREACTEYLELADRVYADLVALVGELQQAGFADAALDCPSPAEMRARVESLFGDETDGAEGLNLAHAYWQDLKHKWGTPLYEKRGKMFAETRNKGLAKLRALDSSKPPDSPPRVRAPDPRRADSEAALADLKQEVFELAGHLSGMTERIEDKLRSVPPAMAGNFLKLAKLELQNKMTALARRTALEAEDKARKERLLQETSHRLTGLRKKLHLLGEEVEERFARKIDAFGEQMAALKESEVESSFEELHEEFARLQRERTVKQIVFKVLKQRGFQEVREMQTITPGDLRSSYFQLGDDETHLVEVEFAGEEQKQKLRIDVVRTEESDGSNYEKRADEEMQRKVCRATDIIQEQLGPVFAITELVNEKPGIRPVPYRESLQKKRRHKTCVAPRSKQLTAKP